MSIKSLALGLPVAALTVFAAIDEAAAASFSVGDVLNITGGVTVSGSTHNFTSVSVVPATSTGGFSALPASGSYSLLSADFASPASYVGMAFFTSMEAANPFKFVPTAPAAGSITYTTGRRGTTFNSFYDFVEGSFTDLTGTVVAKGFGLLTAQGRPNDGSFSATFEVTEVPSSVPEPATVFALLSGAGGLAVLRRRNGEDAV